MKTIGNKNKIKMREAKDRKEMKERKKQKLVSAENSGRICYFLFVRVGCFAIRKFHFNKFTSLQQ